MATMEKGLKPEIIIIIIKKPTPPSFVGVLEAGVVVCGLGEERKAAGVLLATIFCLQMQC